MAYGTSWHANFYPRYLYGAQSLTAKQTTEDSRESREDTVALESFELFFPEGILEKVFSYLPIDSLIRASSVSKQWYEAVYCGKYKWNTMLQQRPWYFMFTCSGDGVSGFAYDPKPRKWFRFQLPCIEKSNWSMSSSCGLVCMMDSEDRSRVFVCNPIVKGSKKLPETPGSKYPDYCALAISVDKDSESYKVAVVECKQEPVDYCRWEFSIYVYESRTKRWVSAFTGNLDGWRGGDECVICGEFLYYLIYSTAVMGNMEARHCIVKYDLSKTPLRKSLMDMAIPVPCSLTCGRLMNLKDKLVMVGGIGKQDRPGIIKGIGIWELKGKEWCELARMPHKYFQGFGEFDDVFASSGAEDLIYIQSFGSPALLTFDMKQKLWKWSAKGPVAKRFPLQLFTGFCFEPRFEVSC